MSNIIKLDDLRAIKKKSDNAKEKALPKEEKKSTPEPHQVEHRKRAKQRILESQIGATLKRDIVEALLFYCLPRVDTKPLATAIMKVTGSNLTKMLFLQKNDISNIPGVGENFLCMLRIMREIIVVSKSEELSTNNATQFTSWDAVHEYLKFSIGYLNIEQFHILILGSKNELIKDVMMSEGTVNHTSVYIREVVKVVLENFGISIILSHNHPSGDVSPSREDIAMTESIIKALNVVSIRVQDHVIVGKEKHFSFRENKMI